MLCTGIVPASWQRYKMRKNVGLSSWIGDFAARLQSLEDGAQSGYSSSVWLGGLAAPSSFITATRQVLSRLLTAEFGGLNKRIGASPLVERLA